MNTRAVLVALLTCACAATPVAPPPTPPVERAEPAPKKAESSASPAPADAKEPNAEILLDEGTFVFDAEGRRTATYRMRFRILRESAIEGWGTMRAYWAPWHEKRPQLRATVKLPDGRTFELDPKTIEESSVQGGSATYTDRRMVRAPIPGIEVGAVVEQTTILVDEEPFFVGGALQRFYFGSGAPTKKSRLVIDVPEGAPLRFAAMGFALDPKEDETAGGRRRVVFEGGPYAPQESQESLLPPELAHLPKITFSVAPGWAPIASRYAELVEETIAKADVRAIAPAAADKKRGRDAIIRATLAKLHARVRYTGIEFGMNAIVPVSPATVLDRGFGDCKDKAALLIAALRAEGIDAHVALLRSGFGADVGPVSALNAFDHAIVYLPGDAPAWIDATADDVPFGELPLGIQGRSALIARANQSALVRIPEHGSSRNTYREERRVVLSNLGGARVVETSRGTGFMDRWMRREFQKAADDELEKSLSKYVERTYAGKLAGRITRNEGKLGETPFELAFEVEDAGRMYTSQSSAEVSLSLEVLFGWLPRTLTHVPAKGEERPLRENDMRLVQPYVAEVAYRVELPPGFVARSVPENVTERIGPATLLRRYESKDGVVDVSFRFDTGPRRWSAADVNAFRSTYRETTVREQLLLDHRGVRLAADGRVKEALELYRSIVDAEPKIAAHHVRMSQALLDAGFGELAVSAARRAAKLAPKDFFAQFAVGYALACDRFGRPNNVPTDRAGAIAAYRRAKALDPKDGATRQNIVLLLSQNDDGMLYGVGADLAAAAEEIRAFQKDLDDDGLDVDLMVVLAHLGRHDELLALAEKAKPSAGRNAMLAVAVASTKGARAAVEALRRAGVDAEAQQQALESAKQELVKLRAYDRAADLAMMVTGGENALAVQAQATHLRRIVPYESSIEKAKGPEALAKRFMVAFYGGDAAATTRLRSRVGAREDQAREGHAISEVRKGLARGFQLLLRRGRGQLGTYTVLDSVISLTRLYVDGTEDDGFRVRIQFPQGPQRPVTLFVVREGGRLRIRAIDGEVGSVGAEALRLLDAGKQKAAAQWVEWGREQPGPWHTEPKALAPDLTTKAGIRRAASYLMAVDPATAGRAAKLLDRDEPRLRSEVRLQQEIYAANALLLAGRYDRSIEIARSAYERAPEIDSTYGVLTSALFASGRGKALESVLLARLESEPKHAPSRKLLAQCYSSLLGDFAAAHRTLDEQSATGESNPTHLNNRAWTALFLKGPKPTMVEDAVGAASATKFMNPAYLHTLATVYAETDQPVQSMKALQALYELQGTLKGHDWFVVGRIAEAYGFSEAARTAYRRVPRGRAKHHDDTWHLAQRRLKQL